MAFTANDIVWLQNEPQHITTCPVCGDSGGKTAVLRMRSLGDADRLITLLACGGCDSRFWDDLTPLAYERPAEYAWATEFYIEQGAAIDALIEPIARLVDQKIDKFLEIGCGYGFSLDAGQRLFGWRAIGVDPSPLAEAGCRDLGVPIKPIYAAADTDLGGPFDLVYGSEVIEHVSGPDEFLQICRAHLSADGILALTTPDADCIRPDTPMATLLPALSPGHHLILFSVRGLTLALKRAGFTAVAIRADGPRLIAYAANRALDFDPLLPLDRELYRDYLGAVLRRAGLPGSLEIGLRARLFKDLTNAGDYPAAQAEFDRLTLLLERNLAIALNPAAAAALADRLERAGMSGQGGVPWSLPIVYYCRGIIEMNRAGRHADAVDWFDASTRLATACKTAYAVAGIEDGETSGLQIRAQESAIQALSFVDPTAAVERLRDAVARGIIAADAWQDLVIRLINLDQLELAETTAEGAGAPALAALARGFLALHRKGDAEAARIAFEEVLPAGGELIKPATQGLLQALSVVDPAAAIERMRDAIARGVIAAGAWQGLVIRLVNLDRLEFAEAAADSAGEPALKALARGFLALHRTGDAEAARSAFEAALPAGGELTEPATRGLLLALTELDPDRVAARVEQGGIDAGLIEALFSRLADLGHTAQASRLETLLVERETWPILGRIGLIKLLQSTPADAIEPLARAFALARQPGSGAAAAECCLLKQREMLAQLLVRNIDGAASAAAELLDPAADDWVSPAVRAELETQLAAHPDVRNAIRQMTARSVGIDRNARRTM